VFSNPSTSYTSCHVYGFTIYGAWIGNRIYLNLNIPYMTKLYISLLHTNTPVSTVRYSLVLLLCSSCQASNNGRSPSSGFLNSSHASATVTLYLFNNLIALAPLHLLTELLASAVDSELWTEPNCCWLLLVRHQHGLHKKLSSLLLYHVGITRTV
jgi:hypothetical protein